MQLDDPIRQHIHNIMERVYVGQRIKFYSGTTLHNLVLMLRSTGGGEGTIIFDVFDRAPAGEHDLHFAWTYQLEALRFSEIDVICEYEFIGDPARLTNDLIMIRMQL